MTQTQRPASVFGVRLCACRPTSRRIQDPRRANDSADHVGQYGAISFGPRQFLGRFVNKSALEAGHKNNSMSTQNTVDEFIESRKRHDKGERELPDIFGN